MFPTNIQNFAFLPNNSYLGRKWFFTITTPSDEDIGKLLDDRKNNTVRWMCCYKMVYEKKFPYLHGRLIFKEHPRDRTWLNPYLCNHAIWFIMKGYENQVVQHCTKDFNQGKDNTTLIYDDGFTNKSIPVNNTLKEYGCFTQLLTEDKLTIYEICENYPHIYETYYKVLERIAFERYRHKERRIPEFNWICGPPRSGKTKFAQNSLKTYDLTKKQDFNYTKLQGYKNVIF
jgi:hypothetical protein